MPERIVPMIHVPDVASTAEWYASIGFTIRDTARECDEGEMNWALLRLGESAIMLSAGGNPSDAPRREFDLYIHVDDIDATRQRLDGKINIRPPRHLLRNARIHHSRLQRLLDHLRPARQHIKIRHAINTASHRRSVWRRAL